MTDNNKLFESIINSGKEQAATIAKEADEKAEKVIAEARGKADSEAESVKSETANKAVNMKNSALSSASLITRNASLQTKRAEIQKTIDGIISYISELDDKSYFELIYKIASSLDEKSGTLLLSGKDKKRLPADFSEELQKVGVDAVISEETADIPGGFILRCGEIEINCSLNAIIDDRKNELEDFINQKLFIKEN